MKIIKPVLLILISFSVALIHINCNDSGVSTTTSVNSTFTMNNFKPLAAEENATYELFVSFTNGGADHNSNTFSSMGKFNVSSSGQLVDTSGQPMVFKFRFTPDMTKGDDAIVTVEPKQDTDTLPDGPKILGGEKTLVNGTYIFNMNMSYIDVLGDIGAQFLTDSAKYILASPTSSSFPSAQYNRGIWFTNDSTGTTRGISSAYIADSLEWIYHAYVIDTRDSINNIYDMGQYADPNLSDAYNNCLGPNPGWSKPGQDWLQANCPSGIPSIDGSSQYSLNNGFYKAIITLEPKTRSSSLKPFFLRLFYGQIPQSTVFNSPVKLTNVAPVYLPTGVLQIK